jgi:hypothetical protein
MNLAKSAKWRERQKAYEAGKLHEWEAQRSVAQAAPPAPSPPPANPFDNYERISTPEGMIWVEGERFPRWGLPINSDRRGLGHLRNPNT